MPLLDLEVPFGHGLLPPPLLLLLPLALVLLLLPPGLPFPLPLLLSAQVDLPDELLRLFRFGVVRREVVRRELWGLKQVVDCLVRNYVVYRVFQLGEFVLQLRLLDLQHFVQFLHGFARRSARESEFALLNLIEHLDDPIVEDPLEQAPVVVTDLHLLAVDVLEVPIGRPRILTVSAVLDLLPVGLDFLSYRSGVLSQ